jgi:hypothetical protein
MKRLRIIHKDGCTTVYDLEAGKFIQGLVAVRFEHDGCFEPAIVTLSMKVEEVEIEAEGETRHVTHD